MRFIEMRFLPYDDLMSVLRKLKDWISNTFRKKSDAIVESDCNMALFTAIETTGNTGTLAANETKTFNLKMDVPDGYYLEALKQYNTSNGYVSVQGISVSSGGGVVITVHNHSGASSNVNISVSGLCVKTKFWN